MPRIHRCKGCHRRASAPARARPPLQQAVQRGPSVPAPRMTTPPPPPHLPAAAEGMTGAMDTGMGTTAASTGPITGALQTGKNADKVWPTVGDLLDGKNGTAMLWDVISIISEDPAAAGLVAALNDTSLSGEPRA